MTVVVGTLPAVLTIQLTHCPAPVGT